jgi:uncharacterized protein YegP (UPF0339 family)
LLPLADGRNDVPATLPVSEFAPPRHDAGDLPFDITVALGRMGSSRSAAPRADSVEAPLRPRPDAGAYFEIYRAERVSLTSILFSGGDWRWRFCSASGVPIAVSAGYASERACAAAVASLRRGAGASAVRGASFRPDD